MRFEIELKAHAMDPAAVRRALDGLVASGRAAFVREFRKSDRYFLLPGAEPGQGKNFRARSDGEGAYLTWKQRSKRGGLEVNLERECRVDDPEPLIELLASLGAKPYFTKTKIGREYAMDGLTVEFCEVPPLGWFVEIECVVDASADKGRAGEALHAGSGAIGPGAPPTFAPEAALVESVRAREVAVLALIGISESEIEERPYSAMLAGYKDT